MKIYFHDKNSRLIISIAIAFILFFLFLQKNLSLAANKGQFPKPLGYVSDYARLISSQTVRHLDGLIAYMQQKTGAEVAVAIQKTIAPYAIEDYAVQLFEAWGIGKKGKDNGVLILVALQERQVRIEVGYGLEGAITDGTAGDIIRSRITPAFKEGRFDNGIIAGTEEVLRLVAKEYNVKLPEGLKFKTAEKVKSRGTYSVGMIFSLLMFLFILIFLFKTGLWPLLFLGFLRGGGGGWSRGGGGFGGGFGGFGGGMSGGGGASGGW